MSIFDDERETTSDRVFREVARPERAGASLVLGTLVFIVMLLAAAYVGLYALAGDRVPRGARVEGVRIGGMTPAAAEQRLRAAFAPGESSPVSFTYEGRVHRIVPAQAGLRVDYPATVTAAGGHRSWQPGRLWDYFTGGGEQAAVVTTDEHGLDQALGPVTASLGRPAVEGTIRFTGGHAVPVYGRSGLQVDATAIKGLLADRIFHPGPAVLPVSVEQPAVTREAVEKAMSAFARPAMSAPVVIVIGTQPVVAPPRLYGQALRMVPEHGALTPVVDGPRLVDALRPMMTTIGDKPKDAVVHLVAGRPVVVPAVTGAAYDVNELARQFLSYAAKPLGQRRLVLHAATRSPAFTTVDAYRLGVHTPVATYQAPIPPGVTMSRDLVASAKAVDNALLKPHATFSLAARLGSRISGDGTSRLATGLFAAMFRAGLADAGHTAAHQHAAGQPLGLEVLAGPGHDLRFTNPGPYGVLVDAVVQPATESRAGSLTVRLWSTRHYVVRSTMGRRATGASPTTYNDQAGCRPRTGHHGVLVAIRRKVRVYGSRHVVATDVFRTRYDPTPTVRCTPPPAKP